MLFSVLQYYLSALMEVKRRHYMQEVAFSIPVSGVVRIEGNSIVIMVSKAETSVSFEPLLQKKKRISLEKGRTLEAAQEWVKRTNENQFSAAQLYSIALEKIPDLKRNSWGSHVVACAANHPSQKYYGSRRDYFGYLQDGTYRLKDQYLEKSAMEKDGTIIA